ncbi:hypothetical protein NQ314_020220 [Rhamnusium bicolor]|uniref:PiggyBac transposable element-derived protein domain-containing protein n=1 Tax=Rhamnusium bicolor TaxID=1586634 RepID=A0AAV8WLE6_9CUCU|nr:hypothetical protein NQ314_020220 [Rhamnusium bicolor]
MKLPVLIGKAAELGEKADPFSVWCLPFTHNMLSHIVEWTNCKIREMQSKYQLQSTSQKETDVVELKTFFGLLIFTSVFNSNHENIETLFATDGSGREIFRAVMSAKRFPILLSALRFDNRVDREERRKVDPTAPISFNFKSFFENCQNVYGVGQSATIDEVLVSFRGRCRFKMYMQMKPCKYGIKIKALTDARNSYLFNAYKDSGKNSDGIGLIDEYKRFSKPTQTVLRLAEPLFGSNLNITVDNWLSSIELVNILSKNKLTYVGTLKKKQERNSSTIFAKKN